MRETRGLLILLAVVIVGALVVWFAIGRRGGESRSPAMEPVEAILFDFDEVAVRSPDLRVGQARVRGAIQDGFSSWLVVVDCAQTDGCAGEFAVRVSYHTGSEARELVLANGLEVPMGGELRFQGLQDPSTPVDRIDKLSLVVRSLGGPSELPYDVID